MSDGGINLEDVANAIIAEHGLGNLHYSNVYESVEVADLSEEELWRVYGLIAVAVVAVGIVKEEGA
jgi:hypothetical protein